MPSLQKAHFCCLKSGLHFYLTVTEMHIIGSRLNLQKKIDEYLKGTILESGLFHLMDPGVNKENLEVFNYYPLKRNDQNS
jgi:hypothetical protein